jgi:hypothetical protein
VKTSNATRFYSYLLACKLNSPEANYKASTSKKKKTTAEHLQIKIRNNAVHIILRRKKEEGWREAESLGTSDKLIVPSRGGENSDVPMDKGWKNPDLLQPNTFKRARRNQRHYNYVFSLISRIVKTMSGKNFGPCFVLIKLQLFNWS